MRRLATAISTALLALSGTEAAHALPITSQLTIQPISVAGRNPAGTTFEHELDKIFEQAGVDVEFLPFTQLSTSSYLFIGSETELSNLFLETQGRSADPHVINMWFVDSIEINSTAIAGYANGIGSNEIALSWGIIESSDAFGILSHELGHSLGLEHSDDPYGFFGTPYSLVDNLMSIAPGTHQTGAYDDISPDGGNYFWMNSAQVEVIRSSEYVQDLPQVPEPTTMLLLASGLVGLAGHRRKRKK